jgi:DNA mismatch repair protein MutS2
LRNAEELAQFAKTIDLDAVRAQVAARAASEPGRALALALGPLDDRAAIEEALARTRDAHALAAPPDLSGVAPAGWIFDRAQRSKRPLDPRELWLLAQTVRAGEKARAVPLGSALSKLALEVDPLFAERVEAALEPETQEVKEELLRDVREAMRAARAELAEALEQFAAEHAGCTVEERQGRLCVASRTAVPGTLVDRDGAVGFFEPESARELSNRALELELEESARTEKILLELDALADEHEPALRTLGESLARLDLHLALGRFARDLGMTEPSFGEALHLEHVRHPVLIERGECIPIDVTLDPSRYLLLVITGPNGGGKTVALKTVGLVCVLALSGSFVPARRATVPFFEELLAAAVAPDDFAHGLSTFEVHARRLAAVAKSSSGNALVLLDELGLGTDPIEGGALGSALLEFLLARRSFVLATTHLGPIKKFAETTAGAAIASVAVDARGKPLYSLTLGKAGESSALEVARRSGVPEAIVARAEAIVRGR